MSSRNAEQQQFRFKYLLYLAAALPVLFFLFKNYYTDNTMAIKNVVLVGAGGNLGPSILHAFLKHSPYNVSVLSRQESTSTFPSEVKVLKADYTSIDSLTTALKGQDAVISLVGRPDAQQILVDASIAAGVQRFIPSEFGSNTADPAVVAKVPIFKGKVGVIEYLQTKEKEISWSGVITGPFFDWGLKVGFLGLNAGTKTATLIDGGKARFSGTNLHQIGLALIKVLEKAEETKNKYIYVSSFETTQNDLLAEVEKITGEKWTVTQVKSADLFKEGGEKLAKGDFSGIPALLQGNIFGEEELSDSTVQGLWNEKLGLEKESFEESIKAGLAGKLYGDH
ncbi:isoflavone reductase family protein-like protein CipA [Massarina eburnea CBS 473.64]|uniref:Isoflavone reductase family protein-like protein CipA n=1 Tax=Massarina eburnea CBS 473.64 TaxID=1395130 RepID=A0A6A6RLQ0_9PLEO|nr:isoflavone reductase family protein-like protein CipA [Massarina eburnea CBS 473.64]